MNENASWALQKLIYSALSASPHVISHISNRIYDDIPRSAVYPYISFGEGEVQALSGSDEQALVHKVVLHIWSKGNGKKEIFALVDVVKGVLDDEALLLSDHHLVSMHCESSRVRREPKTQSYHGILAYRIVTELSV